MHRSVLVVPCLLAWSGCGDSIPAAQTAPPAPAHAADPIELDQRFVAAIRAAGDAYLAWGRVDERPNIAPGLCRAPYPRDYGSTGDVHLTQADDDSPHGKKLYYLYASERARYLGLAGEADPLAVGFTVVKQSFSAVVVEQATIDALVAAPPAHDLHSDSRPAPGIRWVPTSTGSYFMPDQPRDLFVMTKVATGAVDGTDDGWVYGTIAPGGEVTSAGRVARCMQCHVEDASHERLFGMK